MTDFKDMKPDELRSMFADDSHKSLFDDDDYMVLASQIAETGDDGVTYLANMLGVCDETRSKAVLFAVSRSRKKQHEIVKLLGTCLNDKRPLIVSEAIDGLIRLNDRTHHRKIMSYLTCRSEYVRGAKFVSME